MKTMKKSLQFILTTTALNVVISSRNIMEYCSRTPITPDCETTSLDCNNVKLWSLEASLFQDVNFTLECLSVSNTHLITADEESFDELMFLKYLDMKENMLNHLDSDLFIKLTELEYLDLTNNRLTALINKDLFKSQTKLKVLKLSSNQILHINMKVMEPLKSIKTLNLSDNPFHCDCYLLELFLLCKNRGLDSNVTCDDPENFKGFSWEVIESKGDCETNLGLVDSGLAGNYLVEKYTERPSFSSIIVLVLIISVIITAILLISVCILQIFYFRRKRVAPQNEESISYDVRSSEIFYVSSPSSVQRNEFTEVKSTNDVTFKEISLASEENVSIVSEEPSLAGVSKMKLLDAEMFESFDGKCEESEKSIRYSGEYDNI